MGLYSKSNTKLMMTAERQAAEEQTATLNRDAISDALRWLEKQRLCSNLIDRACARFD